MEHEDGTIGVSFIASKARVAPVKPMTIPRLELQAALIAARLARSVEDKLKITFDKRWFYTDSRTVLSWLQKDLQNFRPFVSYRLAEIGDLASVQEWRWISTADNPTDSATRDVLNDVGPTSRWLRGPAFLRQREMDVNSRADRPDGEMLDDLSETLQATFVTYECEPLLALGLPDISRFSKFTRLIQSTARVLQFIAILKGKLPKNGPVTPALLDRAETMYLLSSQGDSYATEIARLKGGVEVNQDSKIRKLTPVLSESGLLRAKGRIDKAPGVPASMKQPIILDGDHPLTRLLIRGYHTRFNHGNQETVINEIRQRYWITKLRAAVKYEITKCLLCCLRRARPVPPRSGDLPGACLAHHVRLFSYSDIDYFGPMYVTIGRRKEKRWGALFTCLTTRAVHLELAHSLNTDSVIMALRRMAARRGQPLEIHSDNGTNFRGADAELQQAIRELDTSIAEKATIHQVTWKFIPPGAPHMGGSWERLVQSVKRALRSTLRERAPSEETLLTLLAEAEHSMNCRPLTHIPISPSDPEALTPNHFLLGSSSGNPPLGRFSHVDLCSRKHWRIAQSMADNFWEQWVKEYLPTLISRERWPRDTKPLSSADTVIVMDPQMSRNSWLKGVIEATYPRDDGRVRVVKVRTAKRTLTRPSTKVIRLESAH